LSGAIKRRRAGASDEFEFITFAQVYVTDGSAHIITMPANIKAGDLLILTYTHPSPANPAGWTQIFSGGTTQAVMQVSYKTATLADAGASLTYRAGTSDASLCWVSVWRAAAYSVLGGSTSGNSGAKTISSYNTLFSNDIIIAVQVTENAGEPPSGCGMTTSGFTTMAAPLGSVAFPVALGLFYKVQPAASATGAITSAATADRQTFLSFSITSTI